MSTMSVSRAVGDGSSVRNRPSLRTLRPRTQWPLKVNGFRLLTVSAILLFSGINLYVVGNYRYFGDIRNPPRDVSRFSSNSLASRPRLTSSAVPDGIVPGIRSNQTPQFFRQLQETIDSDSHYARCQRYGFKYISSKRPRRIFYGGLIANEPWELLEVVATEVYGVLAGVVFVESNSTQSMTPRSFKWLDKEQALQDLYGAPVIVQAYIANKQPTNLSNLERENIQRNEIVKGWQDMGMTEADVGYVGDADETFSRDFLRAIQVCDGIHNLDYEKHRCKNEMAKVIGETRVFESSPECITKDRSWYHPDMIIGACIEGIGNSRVHPLAPRAENIVDRQPGYAAKPGDYNKIVGNNYPLWSISDFRRTKGGTAHKLVAPTPVNATTTSSGSGHHPQQYTSRYTGYHFHNWFANFNTTRHKYHTFGHAITNNQAWERPLDYLHADLSLAYRCLLNMTEKQTSKRHREPGFFKAAPPPLPIYFADEDYRQRKHEFARKEIVADEKLRVQRLSQKQQ